MVESRCPIFFHSTASVDQRGLLFLGEFVTSANAIAFLLYNTSLEGARIYAWRRRRSKCDGNILALYSPEMYRDHGDL